MYLIPLSLTTTSSTPLSSYLLRIITSIHLFFVPSPIPLICLYFYCTYLLDYPVINSSLNVPKLSQSSFSWLHFSLLNFLLHIHPYFYSSWSHRPPILRFSFVFPLSYFKTNTWIHTGLRTEYSYDYLLSTSYIII